MIETEIISPSRTYCHPQIEIFCFYLIFVLSTLLTILKKGLNKYHKTAGVYLYTTKDTLRRK